MWLCVYQCNSGITPVSYVFPRACVVFICVVFARQSVTTRNTFVCHAFMSERWQRITQTNVRRIVEENNRVQVSVGEATVSN